MLGLPGSFIKPLAPANNTVFSVGCPSITFLPDQSSLNNTDRYDLVAEEGFAAGLLTVPAGSIEYPLASQLSALTRHLITGEKAAISQDFVYEDNVFASLLLDSEIDELYRLFDESGVEYSAQKFTDGTVQYYKGNLFSADYSFLEAGDDDESGICISTLTAHIHKGVPFPSNADAKHFVSQALLNPGMSFVHEIFGYNQNGERARISLCLRYQANLLKTHIEISDNLNPLIKVSLSHLIEGLFKECLSVSREELDGYLIEQVAQTDDPVTDIIDNPNERNYNAILRPDNTIHVEWRGQRYVLGVLPSRINQSAVIKIETKYDDEGKLVVSWEQKRKARGASIIHQYKIAVDESHAIEYYTSEGFNGVVVMPNGNGLFVYEDHEACKIHVWNTNTTIAIFDKNEDSYILNIASSRRYPKVVFEGSIPASHRTVLGYGRCITREHLAPFPEIEIEYDFSYHGSKRYRTSLYKVGDDYYRFTIPHKTLVSTAADLPELLSLLVERAPIKLKVVFKYGGISQVKHVVSGWEQKLRVVWDLFDNRIVGYGVERVYQPGAEEQYKEAYLFLKNWSTSLSQDARGYWQRTFMVFKKHVFLNNDHNPNNKSWDIWYHYSEGQNKFLKAWPTGTCPLTMDELTLLSRYMTLYPDRVEEMRAALQSDDDLKSFAASYRTVDRLDIASMNLDQFLAFAIKQSNKEPAKEVFLKRWAIVYARHKAILAELKLIKRRDVIDEKRCRYLEKELEAVNNAVLELMSYSFINIYALTKKEKKGRSEIDHMELIQDSIWILLMYVNDKFDPGRGIPYWGFAKRMVVWQLKRRASTSSSHMAIEGTACRIDLIRIKKYLIDKCQTTAEENAEINRMYDPEYAREVGQKIGVSAKSIKDILESGLFYSDFGGETSLDRKLSADDERPVGSKVASDVQSPEMAVVNNNDRTFLNELIEMVDAQNSIYAGILRLRLREEPLTYKEIGKNAVKLLGTEKPMHHNSVQQYYMKALEALKVAFLVKTGRFKRYELIKFVLEQLEEEVKFNDIDRQIVDYLYMLFGLKTQLNLQIILGLGLRESEDKEMPSFLETPEQIQNIHEIALWHFNDMATRYYSEEERKEYGF